MCELVHQVNMATENEIQEILSAARKRYEELFPDWEITVVSIDKTQDRNAQIDRLIQMLETMRKS